MNIVLTGFMCAGKTTIGRKVAKLLDYNFIDTDMEIEEDQGCSVEEIFKYGGEECFRDMETKLLEKLKMLKNQMVEIEDIVEDVLAMVLRLDVEIREDAEEIVLK